MEKVPKEVSPLISQKRETHKPQELSTMANTSLRWNWEIDRTEGKNFILQTYVPCKVHMLLWMHALSHTCTVAHFFQKKKLSFEILSLTPFHCSSICSSFSSLSTSFFSFVATFSIFAALYARSLLHCSSSSITIFPQARVFIFLYKLKVFCGCNLLHFQSCVRNFRFLFIMIVLQWLDMVSIFLGLFAIIYGIFYIFNVIFKFAHLWHGFKLKFSNFILNNLEFWFLSFFWTTLS